MHLHDFSGILGDRRTRLLRDTYPTIAPRKLPLFVPQKFSIIKIWAYCSPRRIVAVNQPFSSHFHLIPYTLSTIKFQFSNFKLNIPLYI